MSLDRRSWAGATGVALTACGPLDLAEVETVAGTGSRTEAAGSIPGTEIDLVGAVSVAASGATVFVTTQGRRTWSIDTVTGRGAILDSANGWAHLDVRPDGALRGIEIEPCRSRPMACRWHRTTTPVRPGSASSG